MNETNNLADYMFSRRGLLVAGGLATGLAAGCTGLATDGDAGSASTPLEQANADLVTRFCLDWALRDVEKLVPYLADNLIYQMFEKRPDLIGLKAARGNMGIHGSSPDHIL